MEAGTWYKSMRMRKSSHTVCLLLGSNIDAERNIPKAVKLLRECVNVIRASSTWESASVACCYPDYLNLALLVESPFDTEELKEQVLRPLEARMGRVRTEDKNASRPIDIDIILFDGQVLDPDLWQHVHRALPVSELFPNYASPAGEALKDVATRLAQTTPIQLRKDISLAVRQN